MTIAAAKAIHAPVPALNVAAAGGGLMISAATSTATASTSPGIQRRSTYARSGASVPMPATMLSTASTASRTSTTSNASHALSAPYQSRNRLTSSSTAPAATSSG